MWLNNVVTKKNVEEVLDGIKEGSRDGYKKIRIEF